MRLHAISATEYIAHYDNEQEAFKSRRRTREWTAPALARLGVSAPARVLFVGSGNGVEVLGLRELGYDAWGIDMRPPLPAASPWCRVGDATKPVFVDGEFDVVLAPRSLSTSEAIITETNRCGWCAAALPASCGGLAV